MEAQNLFPGCTFETVDEDLIKVVDMKILDSHPNFSGEVVEITDQFGGLRHFGVFELVYPV